MVTLTKTQVYWIWDTASRGGDYPNYPEDAANVAADPRRLELIERLDGSTKEGRTIPDHLLYTAWEWATEHADRDAYSSPASRAASARAADKLLTEITTLKNIQVEAAR